MDDTTIKEEKKTPKSRKKLIKKILIALAITVLSLLLALVVIATVFQDKIADILLSQAYKFTKVEVKHKDVSLSMIRKFPMASLQVNDIDVAGLQGNETLLRAEKIFLQFNIFDIIRNNYTIRRIDISDADLHLAIDEKGRNNWDIFKLDDTTKSENVEINLNTIQLHNVNLLFEHRAEKVMVSTLFKNLSAKGNFSSAIFTTQLSSDMVIDAVSVNNTTYLSNQPLQFYTKLHIDTEKQQYKIDAGNFDFDILNLIANATLSSQKDGYKLQASLSVKKADIEEIIKRLPESINQHTQVLQPKGILSSTIKIDGVLGKKTNLNINGDFACKNGSIENVENDIRLSKINFQGNFSTNTSDVANSLKISIADFSGKLHGGNLSGKVDFENLNQPVIDLSINGKLNLEDLHNFLPTNYFYETSGNASVDISFKNNFTQIEKITAQDFKNSIIQGNIVFTNVKLQFRENENMLENLSGELQFNNEIVTTNKLKGKIKGNDFVLSGKIENVLPYILEEGNRLKINADLHIPELDLDKLLAKDPNAAPKSKKEQTEKELSLPSDIDCNFSFKTDAVSYNNFKANNASGKAVLENNILTLENLTIGTCDGTVRGEASLKQLSNKDFLVNCNVKLANINIQKLFYAFDNFGQKTLTDKNIKGVANSDVRFTTVLKNDISVIPNSITSTVYINIQNGQLNNFSPLESLSKFVELEELRNIRFATLENQISIENSTITIPAMAIKNNALNLSVWGKQTFAGDIDYHIRLLLKDVLFKKAKTKRYKEDFGEVTDDKTGGYLYLLATGNIDNPKIKLDAPSAKKEFKEQFSEQKRQIQENREQSNPNSNSNETKELNNSSKKQSDIEIGDDW